MIITIDLDADRPLYLQIADGVRRALMAGELTAGDRLPAGRQLAEALGVNLETVQRAYRYLSDEGIVVSRVGRGTRIADELDLGALSIESAVDELLAKARSLGLSGSDLADLIRTRAARV